MNSYRITLISGATHSIDAEGGNKIKLALIGTGAQSFDVMLDGKPCYLNTAAVALVEVVDATDAATA